MTSIKTGCFTAICAGLLTMVLGMSEAVAQASDAQLEALKLAEERGLSVPFPGQCAIDLKPKEYQQDQISFSQGTAKEIIALKKIGAIRIIDLPALIGFVHFKTEVVADQPGIELINANSQWETHCIKRAVSDDMIGRGAATGKVIQAQRVKGGRTNWDGIIIYETQTFTINPLYAQYLELMKLPPEGKERIQVLFKYDPFRNAWMKYMWDVGPLDWPNFPTQNVANALRQD